MTTCCFITDILTCLRKLKWALLSVDCFCMHHFLCANIKLCSIANFTKERHYAKGRIFERKTALEHWCSRLTWYKILKVFSQNSILTYWSDHSRQWSTDDLKKSYSISRSQFPIHHLIDKSHSGNCSTINIKPRMVSEKWSLPNSLRRLMMPWSRMMIWWPALLCVCELWFQAIFRPHPIIKW